MHYKYGQSGWDFNKKVRHCQLDLSKGNKRFYKKMLFFMIQHGGSSWIRKAKITLLALQSQIQGRRGYNFAPKHDSFS